MGDRFLEQQQQTIRLPLYSHEEQRTGYVRSTYQADQFLVNCFPVIMKDPLRDDKPVIKIQSRLGFRADSSTDSLATGLTDYDSCYPKAILTISAITDSIIIAYVDNIAGPTEVFSIVEYRPSANTFTLLGTVATTATLPATSHVHLSELSLDGVPYLGVVISARAVAATSVGNMSWAGYSASTSGSFGALTELTDAEVPNKATFNRKMVGPLTQLNDVIYVMTENGYIHGSVAASITSWVATGVTGVRSNPDRGLGLRRYKHHLVALGTDSIEFFNDEGIAAPALPIARTEQAFIKFGCSGQKACINVDDILWFTGKSSFGTIGLFRLEGYTPVEVTSSFYRRELLDQPYEIDLQAMHMHGCRHIIMNNNATLGVYWPGANNIPTNGGNDNWNGTLVYSIDANAWWFLTFAEDNAISGGPTKIYTCSMTTSSETIRRYAVINMSATLDTLNYAARPFEISNQNEQSNTTGQHDTFAGNNTSTRYHYRIPVMIGTNSYDFETTARKFIRSVKIIGDKIRDYATGEPFATFSSEGMYLGFGIDKSDDLAQNATLDIERETNIVSETGYRYYYNNLGSGRNFKFFIWANTYVPLRLEALEIVIAQGTH